MNGRVVPREKNVSLSTTGIESDDAFPFPFLVFSLQENVCVVVAANFSIKLKGKAVKGKVIKKGKRRKVGDNPIK